MPFDISTDPIYDSILRVIGIDPITEKYSPVLSDVSYIIGSVPEEHRIDATIVPTALKTLVKEGFVEITIDDTTYYSLAKNGRDYINEILN